MGYIYNFPELRLENMGDHQAPLWIDTGTDLEVKVFIDVIPTFYIPHRPH